MKNRSRYPADWFDKIRPTVLKRDGYKCTSCGVAQRAHGYYANGGKFITCDEFMLRWAKERGIRCVKIALQIAHIDQNPANNELDNLRSLCPRCHFALDREHNRIKRKLKGR